MSVGERIKEARRAKGITQKELADLIGVNKNTISGYEGGYREPDVPRIHALSKALDVTGDWLIESPFAEKMEREKEGSTLSPEALSVAQDYDTLDLRGKTIVRGVLDLECEFIRRMSAGTNSERTPAMQAYLDRRTKKPG